MQKPRTGTASIRWWRPLRYALVIGLLVELIPGLAFAQSAQVGRSSAHHREGGLYAIPFLAPGIELVEVTLEKSPRNTNLAIDVSINYYNTGQAVRPTLSCKVNGVTVFPTAWNLTTCPEDQVCVASVTWWADLDALEAANPGVIVRQPLKIVVSATDELAPSPEMSGIVMGLGARLEKK